MEGGRSGGPSHDEPGLVSRPPVEGFDGLHHATTIRNSCRRRFRSDAFCHPHCWMPHDLHPKQPVFWFVQSLELGYDRCGNGDKEVEVQQSKTEDLLFIVEFDYFESHALSPFACRDALCEVA